MAAVADPRVKGNEADRNPADAHSKEKIFSIVMMIRARTTSETVGLIHPEAEEEEIVGRSTDDDFDVFSICV